MIRDKKDKDTSAKKSLFKGKRKDQTPDTIGCSKEHDNSVKQKKQEEKANRSEERSSRRMLTSRRLSQRVYNAMGSVEKAVGRRSDKIANTRRTEIVKTEKTEKPWKRRSSVLQKLCYVFGAMIHWGKQTAFKKAKKPMSRFAIIGLAALVMGVASGGVALAAAMLNEEQPLTIPIFQKSTIVQVNYGETAVEVSCLSDTVGEMLEEHDITLGMYDKITPSLDTPIEEGMEVKITRAFPVHIKHDGTTTTVKVTEGKIAEAMAASELEYDEDDIITPSLSTKVYAGMNITLKRVEVITEVETHTVEFVIEKGETDSVQEGYWHLEQEGRDGLMETTTAITMVDGEEVSREVISENIITEVKNEIRLYGTAKKRSSSGSGSSGDYENIKVTNPKEQATNPSVPAAPSSYMEKVTVHATAYSHTGRTTATGTWPRSTRTLENPGSCAVVPDTFPYGTLLYVVGYGYCIAEDTGGFRHKPDRWNQVDLFMNTEGECVKWGRRREWTAYVLRRGY